MTPALNYIRCCRVCGKYYRTVAKGSKKCDDCKLCGGFGTKNTNEVKE